MRAVSTTRRVVFLLAAVVAVALIAAWWTKGRCLFDGGWSGGEQYRGWCYSDIVPLWFVEGLDRGAVPYLDHPVEYPVLIGAQMWLAGIIVRGVLPGAGAPGFYTVTVLLSAPLYATAAALLYRMGVTPLRVAWAVAAPSFVVYAFMNWDALAVALAVVAIYLHWRGRDVGAGIAAGLGAAAKLFPGFLIPIVIIARLRQGRRRDAAGHLGAAAAAWLVVNVPVMIAAPEGWARFLRLNRTRPADWDSIWYFLQQVRGEQFGVSWLNVVTLVLFVTGAGVILLLGTRRLDPDEYWRVLLPVLCWFLLTNKVYSPQFSIWLLPLMALALPRAATFAAFAVADLYVFVIRFPFLGGRQDITPAPGYDLFAVAILVRAVVMLWIIAETLTASPPALRPQPAPFRSPRRIDREMAMPSA
ncbi:MAG: DUF2029 domain-containing protein [Nitriliruptorales bacterium]|nr:DUF2029 domain-containing protein [Nitriliruptorales bacterium]